MSTPVSGNLKLLSTAADTSNVTLRFTLRGFTGRGPTGQQPLVPGIGVLAANNSNGEYYVDFTPDGTGAVSGTLYSTRDAAGTGDGEIELGTSKQAVWYDMGLIISGQTLPTIPVHAKNGVTLDPSAVTPITTPSVVAAPTGDTTYSRLDGANQPFTSGIQIPSTGVYKLSTDTGISRQVAGQVNVGNGTQSDASGTLFATKVGVNTGGVFFLGGAVDTGISRDSAGVLDFGNGTAANASATCQAGSYKASSSGILGFTSVGTGAGTADTSISRDSAGVIDVGNGTAGDKSGSLQATSYRTATANPAASGVVRLAAADTISFRNAGNSADIALSKSGYDQITATGLSNRILQNFTSTQLTGAGGLSFQAAASKTIKANSLGAHGALLIRLAGSGVTAAGGLANITVQFGGTNKTVLSIPQSTTFIFRLEALLANQNATGTQLITWTSQYNSTLSTQSNNTYSIDTTADQTLALGVIFNNASDNCTFQNMLVEIMPASAAI